MVSTCLNEIFGLDIVNVPSIEMPVEVGYLASILLIVLVLPLFYAAHLKVEE